MTNPVTLSRNSITPLCLQHYLFPLLADLEHVEETSVHHPESNALYHSLQVYHCALNQTNCPTLQAAALLHDIGKPIDYPNHATVGADALANYLSPKIVWLVRHHLDLLTHPHKTRRRLRGTQQLVDLEKLRQWDLAGRETDVDVMDLPSAMTSLLSHFSIISDTSICY